MEIPKRKRTRLKDFDYSANGYYFVTVCTQNKLNILSFVGEGFTLPKLKKYGKIVQQNIEMINAKYPTIIPEKYVIMPNHIHLLIKIENDGRGNPSPTISNVVGWFKYFATKEINLADGVSERKIFQRSFHDHIIRGESDYLKIWNYIDTNPIKWKDDCFYFEDI